MKNRFAEWYRAVAIEPTREQLESRWESISNFIEEYDDDKILAMAINYLGIEQDQVEKGEFIEYLLESDLSFDKGNEKEIRLLSGVALAEVVESEPIKATLAMKCLILFNNNPIVSELSRFFESHFAQECIDLREKLPNLERVQLSSQSEFLTGTFAEGTALNVSTANSSILKALSTFDNYIMKLGSVQYKLLNHLQIYEEESKILSWIVGESSNDLGKALKETKPEDVGIVIGKELADLISVLPGPYAAEAFIKKMLQLSKKTQKKNLTLDIYVDALGLEWKEKLLEQYPLIDEGLNTPVLLAISKSMDVDNAKEWLPAYKKKSGIDAGAIAISPNEIAYQVYLECLLTKSMNR